MINGIMHEGVWLSEPKDIKEAFLNFYKDKFSCHDSHISFPSFVPVHRLNNSDRDFLEDMVSMDEIKMARFVVNFFSTGMFPQGANSAFITLIPKVDFEKAFDSVSWRYLDYVLDKLGFGIRWRNWIKNGLMSARTSILINGNFLRNVIILSEWNQSDMENIIRILNVFYIVSGLKINIHKSNVFGVGVSSSEIVSMAACTGCEAGSLPFSYLGLPIGSNMRRIVNWQVITDRSKARLSKWKANMLSIGGLIRSK
ncbi:hypothetical protein Tco_0109489 [Tanacetum coccineum]